MSNSNQQFDWKDGVTLRDYFEAKLGAMREAIDLARESLDTRLAAMNEFRGAMQDQASHSMSREEFYPAHGKVVEDVRSTRDAINLLVPRNECRILHQKIDEDVKQLREFRVGLEAKASQVSVYGAYALAVLGLTVQIVHAMMIK